MKIIKITSVFCPSCLIMDDILNDLKNIEIVKLDIDFDEEKVKKYNPGNILPVIIFLNDDGKEIKRIIGEKNKSEIDELMDDIL